MVLILVLVLSFFSGSHAGGDQGEQTSGPAVSQGIDVEPSPGPVSAPRLPDVTQSLVVNAQPEEQLQAVLRHLDVLGFPVGAVAQLSADADTSADPKVPADTNLSVRGEQRRGLCIAREFAGLRSHRGGLRPSEIPGLLKLSRPLPTPTGAVTGLNVSLTCQAAWYAEAGKVMRIMRATTGAQPGWTPKGTFKVTWRTKGWTYSTIYKDARLYKIHHFKGAVGFHGVVSPSWIHTKPASHGCVRLPNRDMDWLEPRMPPGALVRVYGAW